MNLDAVLAAVEEEADSVRVAVGVFLADLARVVGGLVLADEDLDRKVRLLHQDAVQAVADEIGVLVCTHLYRHHRLGDGFQHAVGVLFCRDLLILSTKRLKA